MEQTKSLSNLKMMNWFRHIGRRPVVLYAFITGFISFAFNITTIVLYAIYYGEKGDCFTQGENISALCLLFALTWLFVDEVLDRKGVYAKKFVQVSSRWLLFVKVIKDPQRVRRTVQQLFLLLNLIGLILSVIKLTTESTFLQSSSGGQNAKLHETALTIVDATALVFQAFFCIAQCQLIWWPVHRAARSTLMVCAVIQFIVGTLIVVVNYSSSGFNLPNKFIISCSFFQVCGSVITAVSILGMTVGSIYTESDRLSRLFSRIVQFYLLVSGLAIALSIVYLGLSLNWMFKLNQTQGSQYGTVLHANPALATSALALLVTGTVSAVHLQKRPNSNLSVELIDLTQLTPAQCQAYASLIDQHGRTFPGAPDGQHAITLMKAYSAAKVPGMKCKVLRIYKPDKSNIPTQLIMDNNDTESLVSSSSVIIPYDEVKAWRSLDREVVLSVDCQDEEVKSITSNATTLKMPVLSKNQLKKLKKKQQAGNLSKEDAVLFLVNTNSVEDAQKELEFQKQLRETEAIVLLTVIEDYDLTESVSGMPGKVLSKLLGKNSFFKPLCVRLGLLAFHWPFRQSTFYCSPTKRPVARSAAVLRAITEWNKRLSKSDKCNMFLDPRYTQDAAEGAIRPSGWIPVPLPPAHIIDLRPYKNKTLEDYLKAIKYRNQMPAFSKANGEIIETTEFTYNDCESIMRLWHKIAEKRTGEGHSAVLAEPDVQFIETLGEKSANPEGHRSLLFLKVQDEIIASCVLFRLGDTITSDLQGLDHEQSRKYKAYFVMMQHTIEIAIKEGRSFVDFGPTTSKPKLDIGCKSMPIMGGMYAQTSFLSLAIRMAASKVNSG